MTLITALLIHAVAAAPVRDDELAEEFLKRKERWAIKTGVDKGAAEIDVSDEGLKRATKITVAELVQLKKPKVPPAAPFEDYGVVRLRPVEFTVYQIDAELVGYKLVKDDQDLHLVIRDAGGNDESSTMIAEIPDPSVVLKTAPWRPRIALVRSKFYELFKPRSTYKECSIPIRITGVGYFDKPHGQTGVAPNAIELHPVLAFEPK